ncbi:hypothetical protein DPQ33_09895 [Oceanidesulfovibrio indonesiensis]|uniref:Glycosyltransferase 2-like domain-containing protein n=1 Tax=Oceanidesulfovibrio indonesiensis TaxID=54767 RepID=A0A7M3MEX0_9BACT|nr:glycosyltransferase [Oceanidesulfovibrio indonesiensis]TVM17102.1 hypothetical protein DPQ33_09895 [Oceanidesulfovibrio indonesiensis]
MNELEKSLAFKATPEEIAEVRALPVKSLPTFSVVVPSFNQAEFLPSTLDSILNQNYPRMEIFVADGGSEDESPRILEEYKKRVGDSFRYYSHPDGGHMHGVNNAIAATSGEIVAWINSDDIYTPDTFWKIATFFHFNRTAMIVYGGSKYVDEHLQEIVNYPVDWSPLIREQIRRMKHSCLPPQPSLFFKRTAVKLCGELASDMVDYELWLRWQKDLPFFYYDDLFSLARVHPKAISAQADRALLRRICEVVHEHHGVVPHSWTLKMAHNEAYGAAWARGESPPITRSIHLRALMLFFILNLRLSPKALVMALKSVRSWFWDAIRIQ